MLGLGGAEAGVILIIVVVLFGPTLIAFWVGYTLGRKKSDGQPVEPGSTAETTPTEPAPEPLTTTEPDAAPAEEPEDD